MKILLLGFAKIKYTPYASLYIENIDKEKNDVTFLYWNRDCKEETLPYSGINYCEFKCYQEDDVPKWKKVLNFFKYRSFVKKHLKENKYDFAVVLSTIPGVLLGGLLKPFAGKYIFDYRDATYERYGFYKKKVAKLVEGSCATFVSSDGFRPLLPDSEKIHTTHNILTDSLNHRDENRLYGVKSDKIRIAFWGLLRPYGLNETIVSRLANDERFELHYYGREQDIALRLKEYVKAIGAGNIFFHGEYKPADRYEFAKVSDLIHNMYGKGGGTMLMANKYYDGAIFRIPQLCTAGSFMAEAAERAGIGIGIDPADEHFADIVYDYYTKLDREDFDEKCDIELNRILSEFYGGTKLIREITGS